MPLQSRAHATYYSSMNFKKHTLFKAFAIWFLGMIALAYFTYPGYRAVPLTEPNFHTLESNDLYFKNIRSFYYFQKTDSASDFELYQLKSLANNYPNLPITPILIRNWRFDESYLHFQTDTALFANDSVWIYFEDNQQLTDSSLVFPVNSFGQYATAVKLWNKVNQGTKVYAWVHPKKKQYLFAEQNEQKHLLTILKDYFKLVGKFR